MMLGVCMAQQLRGTAVRMLTKVQPCQLWVLPMMPMPMPSAPTVGMQENGPLAAAKLFALHILTE
jgi:hypothetical protein